MSTVIAKNVQVGTSGTATDNFTIFQPATPDGTLRIGNGNTGITTSQVALTSAGNVGIGTSSPAQKLNVVGNVLIEPSAAFGYAEIKNQTSTAGSVLRFTNGSTTSYFGKENSTGTYTWSSGGTAYATVISAYGSTAPIQFGHNTPSMTLDSSGNLGLGVTPSAWDSTFKSLQVPGGAVSGYSPSQIQVIQNAYYNAGWKYTATAAASRYGQDSGVHAWYTAASGTAGNAISFTQAMTLDASGRLGVGSTETGFGFVNVNRYASAPLASLTLGDFATPANSIGIYMRGSGQNAISWASGGYLGFYADGPGSTERARIDSSGKLLVNTSSALLAGNLQVNATGTDGAITSKSSEWSTYTQYIWNATTTDNSRFVSFGTQGTYTERGSIDYNRGSNVTRFITTSDATLKNIIGDHNGQRSREILNTTRIREFAWKADSDQKPQIGVIAQELHETFKGAVSVGGENAQGDYTPWGVDKTAFTFHLIAGWQAHEKIIQEQQAIILAQQTALTALTARVEALESN